MTTQFSILGELNNEQEKSKKPKKSKPRPDYELCPVHKLTRAQSFSIIEAKFLAEHARDLKICINCQFAFEQMVREA